MTTAIIAIVLGWGTPDVPRATMVGEVVSDVARNRNEAALILSIIRHESNLDYHVHAGLVSPIGTQDGGRARCLGQIHRVPAWWTQEQWRALAGTSRAATYRCIRAIQRVLDYHQRRCRITTRTWPHVAKLLGAYWKGTTCRPFYTRGQRNRLHWWYRYRRLIS